MSFSEIAEEGGRVTYINLDHIIRAHYDRSGERPTIEVHLSDGARLEFSGRRADRLADALKIS